MIHGIYLKNKPKAKWSLFSISISAEMASDEMKEAIKKAKSEGFEAAEVGVQVFDTVFHIPETLSDLKDHKLMYN